MRPNLGHSITDGLVGVQDMMMLAGIPLHKGGELGAHGLEKTNNNTDGSALHLGAELLDGVLVGNTVVAVKLHLLPDEQENDGEHEDGGPVLQLLTGVDRRVQSRKLLKNLLHQVAPHLG